MARILGFFGKRKEVEKRKDSAAEVDKTQELKDAKKNIYSSELGEDAAKKEKRVPLFSAWKKWGSARKAGKVGKAGLILRKLLERIRSWFRGAEREEKSAYDAALREDLRDWVEFVVYDSDSDDGIDFVHESELLYGSLMFCSYEDLQRFEGMQRLFSSQQSISDCESDSEEDS